MKEEQEKQNAEKPKDLSRRAFLKDAGLVVGGAALGSVALANACGTPTTVTQTDTKTVTQTVQAPTTVPVTTTITPPAATITMVSTTPKSGYIEWDATKCVSCGRCQQACSTVHEGGTTINLSAIKWFENKWFDGWDGEVPAYPMFCQQCSAPSCYTACPNKDKALCIDATTGARYINKEACIGCGFCVSGCPLSPARVNVDPVQMKAIKCDLCRGRTFRQVAKITMTNPGSGYTSAPSVSISGGGGSGATAIAQIAAPVTSIKVINGGFNYTSAPTVTISSGGGTGATATAEVANGSISAITVTNGGSGYTFFPTIAFSGGGGSTAVAKATLGGGPIVDILLARQGGDYTSAPTITITGGGGSGATATATLSTGQVCIDVCDRGALKLVKAEERL
ncbi:MAG: 4Fe-4S binding protein [Dehalococcoidia bacterium]|nr:4Fe-4S binding protein [Dehalococcoidia bacterium]